MLGSQAERAVYLRRARGRGLAAAALGTQSARHLDCVLLLHLEGRQVDRKGALAPLPSPALVSPQATGRPVFCSAPLSYLRAVLVLVVAWYLRLALFFPQRKRVSYSYSTNTRFEHGIHVHVLCYKNTRSVPTSFGILMTLDTFRFLYSDKINLPRFHIFRYIRT